MGELATHRAGATKPLPDACRAQLLVSPLPRCNAAWAGAGTPRRRAQPCMGLQEGKRSGIALRPLRASGWAAPEQGAPRGFAAARGTGKPTRELSLIRNTLRFSSGSQNSPGR